MPLRYAVAILLLIGLGLHANAQLFINEIVAVNRESAKDELAEAGDWVEVYNAGTKSVFLGGLYATDNKNNLNKYQIPTGGPANLVVGPRETLLLWCDAGHETKGARHLPFRLGQGGEFFALVARDGKTIIDSVTFGKQFMDISWARYPDGGAYWDYCYSPTPNALNLQTPASNGRCAAVTLSKPGGVYAQPVTLSMSVPAGQQIIYTTDGSIPTKGSASTYTGGLLLREPTTIRCRAIGKSMVPGPVQTATYVVGKPSELPVLAITIHPTHLWDTAYGIYANYELPIEVPAHAAYYENGSEAFSLNVSARIAGKTSRRQPKRSFNLFASRKLSGGYINYPIFKDKPITEYKSVTVRSDATSGRNVPILWVGERFKNELMYRINREMGSTVVMQAYQPCVVYLNGKYWGLYNMMERKGSQFLFDNFGIKDVDVITGEYAQLVEGEGTTYNYMLDFAKLYELRHQTNYEYVAANMDLLNYIDYFIYEVYQCTGDYRVNMRYYKPRDTKSKWRWIAYDMDSWHNYSEGALNRFINDEEVFLFAMLANNPQFRYLYANRTADYLNTVLQPANVHRHIDEIIEYIEPEIDNERARWMDEMHYVNKGSRVAWIKDFATYRPQFFRQEIIEHFSLAGEANVWLNAQGNGSIRISTIEVDAFPWEGVYFQGVPLTIEAMPAPGYRFAGWDNPALPQTPRIEVMPKPDNRFVPIFVPIGSGSGD